MISKEDEKTAVDCLKVILALIHEQRYEELTNVVDGIYYSQLDKVLEVIEESIYPYEIDGFDPAVKYDLYEMPDHKSFHLDYPLTSCGEEISGTLFLIFEHVDNGLIKIIDTIDA